MTGIDYRARSLDVEAELIAKTMPPGRVWNAKYDQGRVLGRLVRGLAAEIVRVAGLIEQFVIVELNPLTTRQLITEWEKSVGIPDRCFGRAGTLGERRTRVNQKLRNFDDPITSAQIVDILQGFGETVQLVQGEEANADRLGFGAGPYSPEELRQIRHTLAVRVEGEANTFPLDFPIIFSSGQSDLLQCLVRRLIPANVNAQFFFGENLALPFVAGGPSLITGAATGLAIPPLGMAGSGLALAAVTGTGSLIITPIGLAGAGTHIPVGDVNALDAWALVGSSLGTVGTRAIGAGSDRILLARTGLTTTSNSTITGVTFGGQAMSLVNAGGGDLDIFTGTGRDLHSALWFLDEAGLALASGSQFAVTDSGGLANAQFRLVSASYEGIDQASPFLDGFTDTDLAAGTPTPELMTTENNGIALVLLSANRGTSDGGATEDASYTNMTEAFELDESNSYLSIAETDTTGANFTPVLSLTHETAGHIMGLTFNPA